MTLHTKKMPTPRHVSASRRAGYPAGLILAGGLLCTATAAVATPFNLAERILNGGFESDLSNWSTAGTVNRRLSTDLINTRAGNAGFNGFFTGTASSPNTAFAALGDDASVIGGAPDGGTQTLSQTFVLPVTLDGRTIETYDLTISFRSVFDGDDAADTAAENLRDVFSASLTSVALSFNQSLFSQTSAPLPACGPTASCANAQIEQNPFSNTLIGLLPGTYTLTFTLLERSGGGTNTAAGVDDVSVTGIGKPTSREVAEPMLPLLLGIGLGVLAGVRRRKAG